MLSGHVSVLAWGAECGAVLAVVWACECASDGAVCSAVLAVDACLRFQPACKQSLGAVMHTLRPSLMVSSV